MHETDFLNDMFSLNIRLHTLFCISAILSRSDSLEATNNKKRLPLEPNKFEN